MLPLKDQSGPENDNNERVLHIPQSSSITEASPSDCLVSSSGHLEESYPSAEMQLVYSIAQPTGPIYIYIYIYILYIYIQTHTK